MAATPAEPVALITEAVAIEHRCNYLTFRETY